MPLLAPVIRAVTVVRSMATSLTSGGGTWEGPTEPGISDPTLRPRRAGMLETMTDQRRGRPGAQPERTSGDHDRGALAAFLRAHRARRQPGDVGLPGGAR